MMKAIFFLNLFLITLTFVSCEKDNETIKDNGVLSWTGDYAVDGCGFFITINDHEYKPENESIIDDSFKIDDDINVLIEYQILNRQIENMCGDLPNATFTDGIKIISIEKE